MVTALMFETHTAENCPIGNEKAMRAQMAAMAKLPEMLTKYQIKILGSWTVHEEHLIVYAMEAPNFEAFQKIGLEPEMLAWRCFTTAEIKMAMPMEEVAKRFAARAQSK